MFYNHGMDELVALRQQQQQRDRRNLVYPGVLNNSCGSGSPQLSEMTCNSRKRQREPLLPTSPVMNLPSFAAGGVGAPSAGAMASWDCVDAGLTTTSGRPASGDGAGGFSSTAFAHELLPYLRQESLEIDALVRIESERFRSVIESTMRRQSNALLMLAEQSARRMITEKETELANAKRRNVDLEEKVRQLSVEAQVWFSVAKNHEAVAAGLRSTICKLLFPAACTPGDNTGYEKADDNFVESDSCAVPVPMTVPVADDAQSCCFAEEESPEMKKCKFGCKGCGHGEPTVLVLPCRHLCLCKECGVKVMACPVCGSTKNSFLEIFLA